MHHNNDSGLRTPALLTGEQHKKLGCRQKKGKADWTSHAHLTRRACNACTGKHSLHELCPVTRTPFPCPEPVCPLNLRSGVPILRVIRSNDGPGREDRVSSLFYSVCPSEQKRKRRKKSVNNFRFSLFLFFAFSSTQHNTHIIHQWRKGLDYSVSRRVSPPPPLLSVP